MNVIELDYRNGNIGSFEYSPSHTNDPLYSIMFQSSMRLTRFARKFLAEILGTQCPNCPGDPKIWAHSAPQSARNRVRNRSDFCQPFLTKIDTILGQLGLSINLPEIGQIFVLQFPKNRLNFCQPPVPKKVPIMGHTLRRDATRSCARWCPTIFNDYGLGIVLQPIIYLFTHPCLHLQH